MADTIKSEPRIEPPIVEKLRSAREQVHEQHKQALSTAATEAADMWEGNQAVQKRYHEETTQPGYSGSAWQEEFRNLDGRRKDLQADITNITTVILPTLEKEMKETQKVVDDPLLIDEAQKELERYRSLVAEKQTELQSIAPKIKEAELDYSKFQDTQRIAERKGLDFAVETVLQQKEEAGAVTFNKEELAAAAKQEMIRRDNLRVAAEQQQAAERQHKLDGEVALAFARYCTQVEERLVPLQAQLDSKLKVVEDLLLGRSDEGKQFLTDIKKRTKQMVAKARSRWYHTDVQDNRNWREAYAIKDKTEEFIRDKCGTILTEVENRINNFKWESIDNNYAGPRIDGSQIDLDPQHGVYIQDPELKQQVKKEKARVHHAVGNFCNDNMSKINVLLRSMRILIQDLPSLE